MDDTPVLLKVIILKLSFVFLIGRSQWLMSGLEEGLTAQNKGARGPVGYVSDSVFPLCLAPFGPSLVDMCLAF